MPAADEEAFPDIQVLRQQRNEAKAIRLRLLDP